MTVADARRRPLEALADAVACAATASDLSTVLVALAAAAREAVQADLVVLRIRDTLGELVARAVAPDSSALAAELTGSRASADEVLAGRVSSPTEWAAGQLGAGAFLVEAAAIDGQIVGSVEAARVGQFSEEDRAVVRLIAAQLTLALRGWDGDLAPATGDRSHWLELAGDALAAGADSERAARQALRIAVSATGAGAGVLWSLDAETPKPVAVLGDVDPALGRAADIVAEAARGWQPAAVAADAAPGDPLPSIATLPLGQPTFAVLQLFYARGAEPSVDDLPALAAFAARAAHALRTGERAEELGLELDRTRALLEVVAEAISHLSLAHTLETAVDRVCELLQIEQLGVYLLDGARPVNAAGRGLQSGHEAVAACLIDLILGPMRARATLLVDRMDGDPTFAETRTAIEASGQRAALAVPLRASEETIGLLVAYPGQRSLAPGDITLLAALAVQLAVAVQNASLHERSKELGETLAGVLASERQSTRQLIALYEISRSFAQSLSLERTLAAVTSTIVEVLGVDAAVIRVPDERGDQFVPRAVHVVDSRLAEPVRTILERPQPRPARGGVPLLLDADTARRLGGAHALLVPFLDKGSTAALLPIATATEQLAQLTILSLDPAVPIDAETLATAETIAQQAALAIDNARLYQQQKQFAETMQQSLLPRERPAVSGLEVGAVYESAAQVDVGGDVFDFLELPDGRLAVVLGDVTGHGIDATADMAMAKFVFRSLARDHPDPALFLRHANDVVVGEIATGKFITMVSLLVAADGELSCASAGHPEPRLIGSDGVVAPLPCRGLALGIDDGQTYEPAHARLEPGAAVVLYTDGVVEARRDRELFGVDRLDLVLAEHRGESAQAVAEAALEACRAFAGGNLADDCAVVVIRRSA